MVEFLSSNFVELIGYLLDANKRIFGLYLVGAILLAIPVYWRITTAKSVLGFGRFLFPKAIYLSRSAQHDYLLLVCNKLIKAILFAPLLFTMVPIALGLSDFLELLFTPIEPLTQNLTIIITVFTILLFILDDLTRFLLHLALHKIPFLWEFHKVHHSASVMTPFTIYRTHPVESYLYACRMTLTQGIAVGIGYYLFGPNLKMFDVLGANVFVFLFNVFGSNLRHSHIWLSWGDKIENWFISPAQHQIHHSIAKEHRDTNLGSALSLWDKLYGSLIKASSVKNLTIGVSGQPGHDTLMGIYINPFKHAFGHLRQIVKPKKVSKINQEPHN
ncbi:sterol desaturase family protein [Shewanella basaltis]|uniref:sterol desaturase family protein n=1 Tax=Shewanella basaltis TaxID=472183 RepID=UPI00200D57DC|nr:sterol desaturase family protein [Shewanella basaltis]